MKIGILGAGAGGTALAFELSKKRHQVFITDMPEFLGNVKAIQNNGGVYSATEKGDEFAKVQGTDKISDVIEQAEIVFVVTPAFGTRPFASACKPYVKKGQKFIVCPGSGGGALEFKKAIGVPLLDEDILVAETHTLPYAVRMVKPGVVNIYLYVDTLIFTVLPSKQSDTIFNIVETIWPDVAQMGKNVFETTLIDGNPVIHPPVTLMNAALIERTKGDFRFYTDGITNSVANVMKAVDDERLALARVLEVEVLSEPEMSCKEGYIEKEKANYWEGYNQSEVFGKIKAQDQLDHRYLTEDVGYVMVFWSTLGQLIGVNTPMIDAIITMTSAVLGKDLRAIGVRTADSLGLTKEIIHNI